MRQTVTHKKLLQTLKSASTPVSVDELLQQIHVNKTTIYRQLNSLCNAGLISQVRFSDRKIRYELTSRGHHHHLVCTGCNKISDVTLPENLEQSASKIASRKKFLIQSHYLEFFGLCHNCQSA